MRVAPAWIIRTASSYVRMPPAALTPSLFGATCFAISATSSAVAPPLANPVEVFT